MNKVSVPLSDGSCGDVKSPNTPTYIEVDSIYSQIKKWSVVEKTLLMSMLAHDVHHQVSVDARPLLNSQADNDSKANAYESDNKTFFSIVRRTLVQLEKETEDKLITQSGRYAKVPADYTAEPVITIVNNISRSHVDIVQGYIAKKKSVAQCVCAFYAGLYEKHLFGNVTKVVIAEVLKKDEDLNHYRIDYLKKALTPNPHEDWSLIYKVIEEETQNS